MHNTATEKQAAAVKGLKKWAAVGACCLVMPFVLNGCALAIAGAAGAGGAAAVHQDNRSLYNMAYDEGIEQQSYRLIKSNSLLSKPEDLRISVTAFNGNVLITGQTINRDYIKWVVKKIEGLEHVRKVYNYATLQKPVSARVVSSDSYITSKVKAKLLLGKDINSNRFKVVTENGNVFLMGIVNKDESKRAINTVLGIDGVRKVYHIFDYIDDNVYQGNSGEHEGPINVTPQKGNSASYQRPQRNSSYVPPVENKQNGGAYIIEEDPVLTPVADEGPSSLLLPASEYN